MTAWKKAAATAAALVTGAGAIAGWTAAPVSARTPASADATELTIAALAGPTGLDPADASGFAMPVYQAAYDTLIRRMPDGTFAPMLAREWAYDDALTTLTLTLRDDVTFDDDTPFDAQAVKANLDRFREAARPETAQSLSTASVDVVDATTVVIHLDTPDPALINSLADAYGFMANPSRFGESEPFANAPDGTGPYDLDEGATVVGSSWSFVRDDDYWGEQLPFERITYLILDDENALVNGLRTGQIDTAIVQEVDQQIGIESDPMFNTASQEIDLKIFTLFDRTGEMVPELADVRVRQAINYALDRELYVEVIQQGRGSATSQIWGPAAPGFDEALEDHYAYDPERAQELLDEAGVDGLEFTIGRLPGLVSDALAEGMRTDLANVGITLNWEDGDQGSWIAATWGDRRYPGVVMNGGQPLNDAQTINGSILGGTLANPLDYSDPALDELIGEFYAATGDEADVLAQQINAFVVEQAWFVPLFRMEYLYVAANPVTVTPQAGMALPAIYNYSIDG